MAVLREVVTRFRLESSEQDFRGINLRVDGVKNGLRSLASVFGITLGVGGAIMLGRMALNVKQIETNLKYLAGDNAFGKLQKIFSSAQTDLEKIRIGASKAFRPEQYNEAAVNFVRIFGAADDRLNQFGEMWAFAQKQSLATGKNVVDIARDLQGVLETGNLEPLLGIPGFDIVKKQLDELQLKWREIGPIGGKADINARMREMLSILRGASAEQDRFIHNGKKMPEQLLTAAELANKMRQSMEHIGKLLDDIAANVLPKLVRVLDWLIQKFDLGDKAVNQASKRMGEYAEKQKRAGGGVLLGPEIDYTEIDKSSKSSLDKLMNHVRERLYTLGYPVAPPEADRFGTRSGASSTQMPTVGVQYNTFTIVAPDTLGAGLEVKKIMGDMFNDARASSPPTEGR